MYVFVFICMCVWASQEVLVVKNLPGNAGGMRDADSIPRLGRSLQKRIATHSSIPTQRIPQIDRGAWWTIVHRVAKSWAQLK